MSLNPNGNFAGIRRAVRQFQRNVIAGSGLILLLCVSAIQGAAQPSQEYQVKAVFLFNFAQFVEWPSEAFVDDQSPLIIGILGTDPFGAFLDRTIEGEKVNGHPLEVRRFKDLDQLGSCHILYAGGARLEHQELFMTLTRERHILTVGEAVQFARSGGMIRFMMQDNRIRIRINVDATKAAGLTISSKLLRLAEIVESEEKKN